MNLSNLNNLDKKQFLHELKNYLISYRDQIGVDEKYTFGVEIEFVGPRHEDIRKIVKDQFNDFLLVHEGTLNDELHLDKATNVFGGEIKSPILVDEEKDWKKLEQVCSMLKENKAYVNGDCGGHIHVGSQILENKENLKKFLKLWSVFEDIIYRFGYGEDKKHRSAISTYAKPISNKIKAFLDEQNKVSAYKFNKYLGFDRLYAMNFRYTFSLDKKYINNTIELRCPNGTLNPIIWQNNINFFVKLLLRCTKDENWDIIDKYIEDYNSKHYKLHNYNDLNIDKALILSDFIFEDELDKKNFMKQYIKIKDNFVNKHITKNKKITR